MAPPKNPSVISNRLEVLDIWVDVLPYGLGTFQTGLCELLWDLALAGIAAALDVLIRKTIIRPTQPPSCDTAEKVFVCPKSFVLESNKVFQKKQFYVENKTLYMKKVFLFVHHIKHWVTSRKI
jgi:hypothetical protein